MDTIKVTIIEDNRYTARVMKRCFEKNGFVVDDVFNTAEEALEALNNFTSDVIISDLKLSTEMNGLHAGIQIRELINSPIVFYSGTINEMTIDNCLALGNTRFVPKTSSIVEVMRSAKELLEGQEIRIAS